MFGCVFWRSKCSVQSRPSCSGISCLLFVGISCCWLLFCCWGGIYWKWDNFGTSRHRFPYLWKPSTSFSATGGFFICNTWLEYKKGIWEGGEGNKLKASFCFVLNLGCQARSLFWEEDKTTWEVTIDKFNDYMTDLNTRTDQMMEGIMSSQISRELEWVTVISKPSLLPLCSWLILNVRTSAAGSVKNGL